MRGLVESLIFAGYSLEDVEIPISSCLSCVCFRVLFSWAVLYLRYHRSIAYWRFFFSLTDRSEALEGIIVNLLRVIHLESACRRAGCYQRRISTRLLWAGVQIAPTQSPRWWRNHGACCCLAVTIWQYRGLAELSSVQNILVGGMAPGPKKEI